ncbi:hypothetical protein KM043_000578 [Ampulex compressa]|nr:hypothetical protein KM043_000578 [Ampulex compressa]
MAYETSIISLAFSQYGSKCLPVVAYYCLLHICHSEGRCIIATLTRLFPHVTIIGEEESSECDVPSDWVVTDVNQEILKLKLPMHLQDVDPKDVCIWVDPLDGTAEYTQGLVEHVTVLVGVAVGQRAIGGVIHQPYYKNIETGSLGRTLWGIDGVGFGGFTPILPPQGKRIITTTRSHSNSIVQAAINALNPDEVIRVGGAGHKVILLLEGKAHAYVFASQGCKRWDTCAPEAVLHAIGGTLTDFYGERYPYHAGTTSPNIRGVLATAPERRFQPAAYYTA